MQIIRIQILIFFMFGVSSCIEPFMPKTAEYEKGFFIEGIITNDPEIPSTVMISSTVPIRTEDDNDVDQRPSYIVDADVFILCDDGTRYQFYSLGTIYKPIDAGFIGEIGKSYKVIINYEGEVFESDFEKLRKSPPIDSLTYKVKEKKLTDDGITAKGYNFYVSTHEDFQGSSSYYRWLVDATYYYDVQLLADSIWDGNKLIYGNNEEVFYCWKSKDISGVYTSGTEGLIKNSIVEAPLNFESQYGDELSKRYSLHVKQLAITEESYSFWKDLDKLINQTGGLYETQPFNLSGNIKCTTNPKINAIGIFEVAGVSEGREFFSKPSEFPIMQNVCMLDTVGTELFPWDMLEAGAYIIYEEKSDSYLTSTLSCFDCTERGGTTTKPPFWEY